jgi:hypothetical protein
VKKCFGYLSELSCTLSMTGENWRKTERERKGERERERERVSESE